MNNFHKVPLKLVGKTDQICESQGVLFHEINFFTVCKKDANYSWCEGLCFRMCGFLAVCSPVAHTIYGWEAQEDVSAKWISFIFIFYSHSLIFCRTQIPENDALLSDTVWKVRQTKW